MSHADTERIGIIAEEAMEAMHKGAQLRSFSSRYSGFDLPEAYAVARQIRELRRTRGATPVGRKIGFTNKEVWKGHGLSGPIWSHVYDNTVHQLETFAGTVVLPNLPEMRIEPEIVFCFSADPATSMSDQELLSCVEWLAHGFEIVFSMFPNWSFTAGDAVAAFGVHAMLLLGKPCAVNRPSWEVAEALQSFSIELSGSDGTVRQGGGAKVLGSPLEAIRFLVTELERNAGRDPLRAGEIVTTGTLTEAMPLATGQHWCTSLRGIELPGLHVSFT
jgi:2-keto-4-pentenoate hydratase